MTGLNIQSLVFLKEGVSICQLFIQILGYYGSKAVGRTVKIYPLPSPPPREGACSRKSNPQITGERQNGASQSHNLCNINEITTSNASHSPRNDIENSCKTQVSGAAATLHKGTRGIDFVSIIPSLEGRGSEEVGDTYPSSGTECHLLPHRGEGINKKILKHTGQSDVLDDRNISMKTEYCRKNLLLVRWMFIMENCNWQYGLI